MQRSVQLVNAMQVVFFLFNFFSIFIRVARLDLCIYTFTVKMQHSGQLDEILLFTIQEKHAPMNHAQKDHALRRYSNLMLS